MSELATYTFLPWLREGIANQIGGDSGSRATIPIDVTIRGDKTEGGGELSQVVSKEIQLYGPGDIVGLDQKAIIKVEPRNGIANFEPNYLPYIDFYDEDLPWRYSPMPNPTDHRLLPWLALVVLKENEFENGKNIKDRPLSYISLTDKAKLPPLAQSWAWAHVHVNRNIVGDDIRSTQTSAISSALKDVLDENPDLSYSRIVCPRKLEDKAAYHAFLVPVFESGRLAGLGNNPETVAFDAHAWDAGSLAVGHQLPYYHRWFFRTGTVGDFEYLVRLLEPKPIDSRVGLRDMDVQQPGANLPGIRDEAATPEADKLNGILKLGGALRIPDAFYGPQELQEVNKYRDWADPDDPTKYPHKFQENLAAFINLTDSYETTDAQTVHGNATIEQEVTANEPETEYDIKNNPDPLITAPLYGRWHALTQRLLKERDNSTDTSPNDNWIHELNLDPRWRVAAGFGTKVVQEYQEDYMKAAWEQVGDVLEANMRIRQAQLAKMAATAWYGNQLTGMQSKKPDKWMSFTAPVHNRVLSEGQTVFFKKRESTLTLAPTSNKMRQLLRPRGKFAKRLPFTEDIGLDNLITRINEGDVSAAPPKEAPEGAQSPEDIAEAVEPGTAPNFLKVLLKAYPWMKWIPLVLALILFLVLLLFLPLSTAIAVGVVAIAISIYLYRLLDRWSKALENATSIHEENQTPESVDELPKSPDFRISDPRENFTPSIGGVDSEEGTRFKTALRDVNTLIQNDRKLGVPKARIPLKIGVVNQDVFDSINPSVSIPRWVYGSVFIPPFIRLQLKERFVEAMAYPKFDLPMYKPLTEYSSELFLPNINFIEQNSISILETNQQFIEAYMVGLNHEFARELLWREYPTDQRGSYFRQFWEVSGFMDTQTITVANLTARYKKILDDRNMPDLRPNYDRLLDTSDPKDEAFLREAHEAILKEELKDIKPLHYWSKNSDLGDHDNRELPGENEEEVVLVIRGELLKKYPTAVIYAHKAVWKDENGDPVLDPSQTIDRTRERTLAPIPEGQEENPPQTIVKSPLYEAKVDPDIYFFGFDLTVCEAKGGTGKEDDPVSAQCAPEVNWDDPGWFFVIKERPGEPRFGLDIADEDAGLDTVKIWNDLSWGHITPPVAEGDFIQINNDTDEIPLKPLAVDNSEDEKLIQKGEDENIVWNKEMNAAELAYVLYQVPVLVAVHASEMLPDIPTQP
ncbi:hypothetical protein WIW50_14965 [Flavobacteriaceae bacterium 3-367]